MANFFDQFDASTADTLPPAPAAAASAPALVPTPTNPDGTKPLRIRVTPQPEPQPSDQQAPTAGSFFDQFDPSVGEDVAKSAGVGIGKGLISLGSMGGDVRDLAARGISKVAKAAGYDVDPQAVDPREAAVKSITQAAKSAGYEVDPETVKGLLQGLPGMGPTSTETRKSIEDNLTGQFYQPQTTPGKYAETVGEFVPAAAAGPGGVVGNLLKLAVAPGLASEFVGHLTEGTPYEPYARAIAAILAGGGASALTRPSSAPSMIRRNLPDYVTDQHVQQAEALISDAANRGVQLTWPEALSQVTGRPVLTDMQRFLEAAPQTRARMQEVHGDRGQEISQAAEGEFNNIAPPTPAPSNIGPAVGTAAEGVVNDIRAAINRATRPRYDAAGQTLVPPQIHQIMIDNPLFQEALDAVRNNPAKNSFVRGQSDRSVAVYDAVKKELEERAQNAAAPANPNASQAVSSATGTLADTVRDVAATADRNLGQPSGLYRAVPGQPNLQPVGNYEAALEGQRQLRETILNPILRGPLGKLADKDITTKKAIEALFPADPLAGSEAEVSRAVTELSARNPNAARQLVRAYLEQGLQQAFLRAGRSQEPAQFAGAGFAHNVLGSPVIGGQRMQNLRAAVEALPGGQQTWEGLSRFLEIAQATGTRQPIGSKTAFNDMMRHEMTSGGAIENIVKKGASPGKWWTFANDAIQSWRMGRNLDQLARLLTDPQSGRLLQRIARAPRNSGEAQRVAAAIANGINTSNADLSTPKQAAK